MRNGSKAIEVAHMTEMQDDGINTKAADVNNCNLASSIGQLADNHTQLNMGFPTYCDQHGSQLVDSKNLTTAKIFGYR